MAVTVFAENSQPCTIGTEHTLSSPTSSDPGVFQLNLDLSTLAAGETLEVRMYHKARSASSLATIDNPTVIVGPAAGNAFVSFSLMSFYGCSFSIKQVGTGTARTIPWSVFKA